MDNYELIDQVSTFIPFRIGQSIEVLEKRLIQEMMWLHGVPAKIILDRIQGLDDIIIGKVHCIVCEYIWIYIWHIISIDGQMREQSKHRNICLDMCVGL